MSWLCYNFVCPCGTRYEDLVRGVDGRPDPCPRCGGLEAVRELSAPSLAKVNIPCYPGYRKNTAGYAHIEKRPAEKKGRQVSMHGAKKS